MRIEYIDGGFVEIIKNKIVEKVVCNYNGICTVYFNDKDKPPKELNVGCSSYNRPYGIPISDDGSKLFIGSWERKLDGIEKGLQAYDVSSGSVLWRFPEGKIRSIFVYSKYLIVLKDGAGIFKLDIGDGAVLGQIKGTTIVHIFDLGFPYVYIDTNAMAGKQSILDVEKMLVIKKNNKKMVNPSNSLSVVIQNVTLQGNILTISGVEEVQFSRKWSEANHKHFDRIIDTDFCGSVS